MNHVGVLTLDPPPIRSIRPDESKVAAPRTGNRSIHPVRIIKITAGNAEGFTALIRPYLSRFVTAIYRILQNDQDVQDALHLALFSIHHEWQKSPSAPRFSTWAYRICIEEALLLRRSRMRRSQKDLRDLMPQISGDLCCPDQNEASFLLKIQIAITRLSPEQRRVFILRDLDGMNTGNVEGAMGIGRHLVRVYLQQARRCLRSVLSEEVRA